MRKTFRICQSKTANPPLQAKKRPLKIIPDRRVKAKAGKILEVCRNGEEGEGDLPIIC